MREIKFRAWDAKKEQMIYPAHGQTNEWDYIRLCLDGAVCLYDTDDGQKNGFWEHSIDFTKDRFILMQYTGLKDKNGREAYLSDRLKSESGAEYEVVWIELSARFVVIEVVSPYTQYSAEIIPKLEIIENPEFLDREKP